jgi:xanthine dehydrogenase large subunit
MDSLALRKLNCYQESQTTPYEMPVYEPVGREMLEYLEEISNYQNLREEVRAYNESNRYRKQGIGIIPGKFGISFTAGFLNQGSSLIWIYADGTISVSHGGIEMGQQVNTKVAQVVAATLGVKLSRIRIESANTKRVGNASPTAASTGSDINGYAAMNAAVILKERLTGIAVKFYLEKTGIEASQSDISFNNDLVSIAGRDFEFSELVRFAYMNYVDLGAHGYCHTPGIEFDREKGKGTPFYYFVYGAALVLTEVDLLTGEYMLKQVRIVHDSSTPINEEIDKGQIYGAFAQGYGLCTMEHLPFDEKGRYLAVNPSTYKIPAILDIPDDFLIEMVTVEREHASVMGSKAVGEPPLIYGLAGWLALYNTIQSLNKSGTVDLKFPATPEAVLEAITKIGEV